MKTCFQYPRLKQLLKGNLIESMLHAVLLSSGLYATFSCCGHYLFENGNHCPCSSVNSLENRLTPDENKVVLLEVKLKLGMHIQRKQSQHMPKRDCNLFLTIFTRVGTGFVIGIVFLRTDLWKRKKGQ